MAAHRNAENVKTSPTTELQNPSPKPAPDTQHFFSIDSAIRRLACNQTQQCFKQQVLPQIPQLVAGEFKLRVEALTKSFGQKLEILESKCQSELESKVNYQTDEEVRKLRQEWKTELEVFKDDVSQGLKQVETRVEQLESIIRRQDLEATRETQEPQSHPSTDLVNNMDDRSEPHFDPWDTVTKQLRERFLAEWTRIIKEDGPGIVKDIVPELIMASVEEPSRPSHLPAGAIAAVEPTQEQPCDQHDDTITESSSPPRDCPPLSHSTQSPQKRRVPVFQPARPHSVSSSRSPSITQFPPPESATPSRKRRIVVVDPEESDGASVTEGKSTTPLVSNQISPPKRADLTATPVLIVKLKLPARSGLAAPKPSEENRQGSSAKKPRLLRGLRESDSYISPQKPRPVIACVSFDALHVWHGGCAVKVTPETSNKDHVKTANAKEKDGISNEGIRRELLAQCLEHDTKYHLNWHNENPWKCIYSRKSYRKVAWGQMEACEECMSLGRFCIIVAKTFPLVLPLPEGLRPSKVNMNTYGLWVMEDVPTRNP